MSPLTSADLLRLSPVIPVVVLDEPAHAMPLAEALLAGGVPIIEITLRTPRALDAITIIADAVPHAIVGAGTVTTPGLIRQAVDAGAQFLVTPGTTDRLLDAMGDAGIPCLPGVASASEVMRVLERGQCDMKFFPAEASGGRAFLSAMAAPFPDARFCPTGGITPATAPLYRELDNVGCVGGSWLTPRDAIAAQDWRLIEKLAAEAIRAPLGASLAINRLVCASPAPAPTWRPRNDRYDRGVRATGTFTVKAFIPVELKPEPAIATGLPVGIATIEKQYEGEVAGRSATLFTAAFDQGTGRDHRRRRDGRRR
jgi:2-dehydro-3-deoxyphosphogluconate aldolase / (4S)-4-hydroxy-2-oxoglutarate aldolase